MNWHEEESSIKAIPMKDSSRWRFKWFYPIRVLPLYLYHSNGIEANGLILQDPTEL